MLKKNGIFLKKYFTKLTDWLPSLSEYRDVPENLFFLYDYLLIVISCYLAAILSKNSFSLNGNNLYFLLAILISLFFIVVSIVFSIKRDLTRWKFIQICCHIISFVIFALFSYSVFDKGKSALIFENLFYFVLFDLSFLAIKLITAIYGIFSDFVYKYKKRSFIIILVFLTLIISAVFFIQNEKNYLLLTVFGSVILLVFDRKTLEVFSPSKSEIEKEKRDILFHCMKIVWAMLILVIVVLSNLHFTDFLNLNKSAIFLITLVLLIFLGMVFTLANHLFGKKDKEDEFVPNNVPKK